MTNFIREESIHKKQTLLQSRIVYIIPEFYYVSSVIRLELVLHIHVVLRVDSTETFTHYTGYNTGR